MSGLSMNQSKPATTDEFSSASSSSSDTFPPLPLPRDGDDDDDDVEADPLFPFEPPFTPISAFSLTCRITPAGRSPLTTQSKAV